VDDHTETFGTFDEAQNGLPNRNTIQLHQGRHELPSGNAFKRFHEAQTV